MGCQQLASLSSKTTVIALGILIGAEQTKLVERPFLKYRAFVFLGVLYAFAFLDMNFLTKMHCLMLLKCSKRHLLESLFSNQMKKSFYGLLLKPWIYFRALNGRSYGKSLKELIKQPTIESFTTVVKSKHLNVSKLALKSLHFTRVQ